MADIWPLPASWHWKQLGEYIDSTKNGYGRRPQGIENGPIVLRLADVTQGYIDLTNTRRVAMTDEERATYKLEKGDVLFVRVNGSREVVGQCLLVDDDYDDVVFNDHLIRVKLKPGLLSKYLYTVMLFPPIRSRLLAFIPPTMGGQLTINQQNLASCEIPLPPLPEQRAIAAILETWDRAIALTERRLAAAEQRKKALMQQLLTGRVRFPEFAGEEWRKISLRHILNIQYGKSPNSIRDEAGIYNIYGTGGVVGKTNKLLCEKSAVIIGRKGTIDQPQLAREPFWAIDTTYYGVPQDGIDVDWIYYTLNHLNLEQYNEASGVPSLSRSTLHSIKIMTPSIEEQRRIAAILNACDRELDLLRRKRDALQRQKKGLMQRLLTGRVRVRGVEA